MMVRRLSESPKDVLRARNVAVPAQRPLPFRDPRTSAKMLPVREPHRPSARSGAAFVDGRDI